MAAMLGILAAIILPTLQGHTTKAKEAAAKDNLRILRNAISVYAAQHNDVAPGYANDDPTVLPGGRTFNTQLVVEEHYLSAIPENPFNDKVIVNFIGNSQDFPSEPLVTDLYGWIYKPATKTIKLNWAGTDSKGVRYFDY